MVQPSRPSASRGAGVGLESGLALELVAGVAVAWAAGTLGQGVRDGEGETIVVGVTEGNATAGVGFRDDPQAARDSSIRAAMTPLLTHPIPANLHLPASIRYHPNSGHQVAAADANEPDGYRFSKSGSPAYPARRPRRGTGDWTSLHPHCSIEVSTRQVALSPAESFVCRAPAAPCPRYRAGS